MGVGVFEEEKRRSRSICLCEVEVQTELSAISEIAESREKTLSELPNYYVKDFIFKYCILNAGELCIYNKISLQIFRRLAHLLLFTIQRHFSLVLSAQKRGAMFVLIWIPQLPQSLLIGNALQPL